MPKASRAEEEIRASFKDANIDFIKGSGGTFDVTLDGELIFSKQNTPETRFPYDGELTKLIEEKLAQKNA